MFVDCPRLDKSSVIHFPMKQQTIRVQCRSYGSGCAAGDQRTVKIVCSKSQSNQNRRWKRPRPFPSPINADKAGAG